MSDTHTINTPQTFHITDKQSEKIHYGANQCWYKQKWQRTSGCGPTTYANIIHYLLQTSTKHSWLLEVDTTNKVGFINLMDDVWSIVTPGLLGIYSIKQFSEKSVKHAEKNGVLLRSNIMKIPVYPFNRPKKNDLVEFLSNSLKNNSPVAFLNRSHGKAFNLSSWHWTTIIGFSVKDMKAEILDNGIKYYIDMGLWLETTLLGGGLVAFALD